MPQEELIELIKKKCRSGYPAGELKLDLLEQGYNEADIDAAFVLISKKDNFNSPLWYIVSVFFIVWGGYQISLGNKFWGWSLFLWGCLSLVIKLMMSYKKESF